MKHTTINCPSCQINLDIPHELFGNIVRCPSCQKKLSLPSKNELEECLPNLGHKPLSQPKKENTIYTANFTAADARNPNRAAVGTGTRKIEKYQKK